MRRNAPGQALKTFGTPACFAVATVSCDRGPAPESSAPAPDVTSAAPGLSAAEMENLVRRSYQYVALYDTIANWALHEKSPFYSGGFNKRRTSTAWARTPA